VPFTEAESLTFYADVHDAHYITARTRDKLDCENWVKTHALLADWRSRKAVRSSHAANCELALSLYRYSKRHPCSLLQQQLDGRCYIPNNIWPTVARHYDNENVDSIRLQALL
jgi:hypothetical protein